MCVCAYVRACVCVRVCEYVSVGGVHMWGKYMYACVHGVCARGWKRRKKCSQAHEVKQQGTWLVMRMCVPSLRTTSPTRARKIWDYRG